MSNRLCKLRYHEHFAIFSEKGVSLRIMKTLLFVIYVHEEALIETKLFILYCLSL